MTDQRLEAHVPPILATCDARNQHYSSRIACFFGEYASQINIPSFLDAPLVTTVLVLISQL